MLQPSASQVAFAMIGRIMSWVMSFLVQSQDSWLADNKNNSTGCKTCWLGRYTILSSCGPDHGAQRSSESDWRPHVGWSNLRTHILLPTVWIGNRLFGTSVCRQYSLSSPLSVLVQCWALSCDRHRMGGISEMQGYCFAGERGPSFVF